MKNNFSIHNSYYNWWKNVDKIILSMFLILFFLGLFFSLVSTSLIASEKLNTNSYYFFIKHFIFVILAIFILLSFSLLNKENLFTISVLFFIVFFYSSCAGTNYWDRS